MIPRASLSVRLLSRLRVLVFDPDHCLRAGNAFGLFFVSLMRCRYFGISLTGIVPVRGSELDVDDGEGSDDSGLGETDELSAD